MNAGRWVLIAANPKSGAGPAGQLVQSLADAVALRGYQTEIIHSLELLQATANRLNQKQELEAVISAGGDGTVSTLANLLPSDVPLLIFPLGTENLLAKYWGLTRDVEFACTTLVGGRTVHMDVGKANGKLFLVMLGCGFDAEVVRQMHRLRSGHISRWSYTMPLLRALKNYDFPQLSWTTGANNPFASNHYGSANVESQQAAWLFVFNVPKYAASLEFCPQADPTDGKLDICSFKHSGRWAGFCYLLKLWQGTHQKLEDFKHTLARKLIIPAPIDRRGNAIDVPFQLDGDPGGMLPLEVEVLPSRLKLIVPETTVASDPISVMPLAVSSA